MEKRSIGLRLEAQFAEFDSQIDRSAQKASKWGQDLEQASRKVEQARLRQRDAAQQVVVAEQRLDRLMQSGKATSQQLMAAQREVVRAKNANRAATDALTQAEKQHEQASQKSTTALGRMAKSADQNSQAWNKAAGILIAAGSAVTALGVSALKTGIEYNTLQQSSRAAMRTLLGGAAAANEQMDKLDAFAKGSPFAKTTFITAQQQMLAFGIETQKVVPYLDALNDATAAAGGSGQTLGELAYIMAQISSAGKITGQDLIQFGQRGVNAAELIGSRMGKTGAEIRTSIVKGTLDADVALDALAAGMKQRYDGAAANVKETWIGATDRIKAAWRDLSSELAESLVGKEGGGALVSLTNAGADLMRTFQSLPGPAKATTVAIIATAGAVSLLGGGLLLLGPRIVSTRESLATLRKEMPRFATAMKVAKVGAGGLGIALAAGVTALAIWQSASADAAAATQALADTFEIVDGKVRRTDDTLRMINDHLIEAKTGLFGWGGDLASMMEQVGVSFADAQGWTLGDPEAIERVETAVAAYSAALRNEMSPQMAASADVSGRLMGALQAQADQYTDAEKKAALKAKADQEAGIAAQESADGTQASTDALQDQAKAAQEAAQKLRDLEDALWDQSSTLLKLQGDEIGWQQAIDDSVESVKKLSKETKKKSDLLDIDTQAGRDAAKVLRDLYTAGQARIQGMVEEGDSAKDIAKKTSDVRKEYVKTAQQMGYTKDEAKKLADELGLIPSRVVTEVAASGVRESEEDVTGLLDAIKELPPESQTKIVATFLDRGLKDAERELGRIDGKVYTTYIRTQPSGTGAPRAVADGGLFAQDRGLVQKFASGGFGQPTVRPFQGAAGVQWGERDSGPWEAFISGAPQKRERSIAIWREVGRRLLGQFSAEDVIAGFASGGIIAEPTHKGKPLSWWEDQVPTDLELTRMKIRVRDLKRDLKERETYYTGKGKGRKKRTRLKLRGLDRTEAKQELVEARQELKDAQDALRLNKSKKGTIEARIAAWEAKEDAAQEARKVAEREASEAQAAQDRLDQTAASSSQQWASSFRQGSSLADLIANMNAGANQVAAMQNTLSQLQSAGLDPDMVGWLQGQGVGAADLAQQILASGRPGIDLLNQASGNLSKAADAMGRSVATGSYGPAPVLQNVNLPGYMTSGVNGAVVGGKQITFNITQSDPYAVAVAVDQQLRYL